MPIIGEGEFLADCLASISPPLLKLDATLLIIDDGISNNCLQLIKAFSANHNVKCIKNSGRGIVDALNTGLSLVETEYVARMDSDDLMCPDRLAKQVERLNGDVDLVAVGGQAVKIDHEGIVLGLIRFPVGFKSIQNQIHNRNCMCHPATMFRLSALKRIEGYRKFYETAEDFDLFLRLVEIGKLDNIQIPAIKYRIHAHQVSIKKSEKQYLASCAALIAAKNRRLGIVEISNRFLTIEEWKNSKIKHKGRDYNLKYAQKLELLIQLKARQNRKFSRILFIAFFMIINQTRFLRIIRQKIIYLRGKFYRKVARIT